MGDHEHFPVLVFAGVLVHILQQLFGLGDPLTLTQAVRCAILRADLGDHAQRTKRHARGAEQLGMALRIAVQHGALGGDQLQAGDATGIRGKAQAGAMGGGGNRPGQGLVIDVRHVRQRLADGLERRPHARHRRAGGKGRLQGGGVMVQQPIEVTQRQQGAVGGHQGTERMCRAYGPNSARCLANHLHQFIQIFGRQARQRQAGLRARPVAPRDQPWRAGQLGQYRVARQGQKNPGHCRALQELPP